MLDLATSHGPESAAANDGSHLTAVACACLLSLVVVRGDTGRLLAAIAALLMSPRALAIQNIQVSYHRSIGCMIKNIKYIFFCILDAMCVNVSAEKCSRRLVRQTRETRLDYIWRS